MTKHITVRRRSEDWYACLTDEPGCWGCGRTAYEAIGALVQAWPERFDIEVTVADGTHPGKGG